MYSVILTRLKDRPEVVCSMHVLCYSSVGFINHGAGRVCGSCYRHHVLRHSIGCHIVYRQYVWAKCPREMRSDDILATYIVLQYSRYIWSDVYIFVSIMQYCRFLMLY